MKDVTHIKFGVEVRTWSIGGYDPEDSWSRDSTRGDVSVRRATIVKKDNYDVITVDDKLAAGTTIYLVWAEYTTGDSFGSDGGNYELLEVCLSMEAAGERKDYYNSANGPEVPWYGYFESLDSLNIDTFVLE